MSEEENKILEDAKKLPLAERVTHGNWKARSAAFEDIKKACDQLFNDGDAVLDQYGECKVTAPDLISTTPHCSPCLQHPCSRRQ
jgi:hypothetical protein